MANTMADTIVANAARIGLFVSCDFPTPGDGNCFNHAVIQQLARPPSSAYNTRNITNNTFDEVQFINTYNNIKNILNTYNNTVPCTMQL